MQFKIIKPLCFRLDKARVNNVNVLIVVTNRYSSPIPVMPVGACMVAEAAELAGHRVRVLDLMFEQNPLNTLESELNTSNPDFIGLSVRNIDNNDM